MIMKKQVKQEKNKGGKGIPDSERLSDYPEGNLADDRYHSESVPGNETKLPQSNGRTIAEATDPSKLSDI